MIPDAGGKPGWRFLQRVELLRRHVLNHGVNIGSQLGGVHRIEGIYQLMDNLLAYADFSRSIQLGELLLEILKIPKERNLNLSKTALSEKIFLVPYVDKLSQM